MNYEKEKQKLLQKYKRLIEECKIINKDLRNLEPIDFILESYLLTLVELMIKCKKLDDPKYILFIRYSHRLNRAIEQIQSKDSLGRYDSEFLNTLEEYLKSEFREVLNEIYDKKDLIKIEKLLSKENSFTLQLEKIILNYFDNREDITIYLTKKGTYILNVLTDKESKEYNTKVDKSKKINFKSIIEKIISKWRIPKKYCKFFNTDMCSLYFSKEPYFNEVRD